MGSGARRLSGADLSLVPRRPSEHLLQRARSPRGGGPGGPAGADLRLAGHGFEGELHLPRATRRRGAVRRRPEGAGRRARRPRRRLHADGPGGGDRHARLRPHRGDPLGGLRRVRRERAGRPHRGRGPEAGRLGLVRDRAGAPRPLQAAARRGDRARREQARATASSSSGRSSRPHSIPAATSTGRRRSRAPSPRTASRSRPRIRSTSSTRPAPPVSRRGSSAIPAATPWHSSGR